MVIPDGIHNFFIKKCHPPEMKKSCRKIKLRMDLLSELKKSMLQLAIIWEDINEKTRHVLVMVVENTVEVVAGEMLSLN